MKLHSKIIISFAFLISLVTIYYSNCLLFDNNINRNSYLNIIENRNKAEITTNDKTNTIDTKKLLSNTIKCVKNKIILIIHN